MIAALKGTIEGRNAQSVIIDVHGVGYKVLLPSNLLAKLKIGEKLRVFTYTHVREDALELYGFLNQEDLRLFECLIGVSGIGPKTALGIFSLGGAEIIAQAVTKADLDFFTNVPRLGKKNAQRIIIELKSRLGAVADLDLSDENLKENGEVIAALKNFGFTIQEAKEAVKKIKGQGQTIEERVRLTLRYLGK